PLGKSVGPSSLHKIYDARPISPLSLYGAVCRYATKQSRLNRLQFFRTALYLAPFSEKPLQPSESDKYFLNKRIKLESSKSLPLSHMTISICNRLNASSSIIFGIVDVIAHRVRS